MRKARRESRGRRAAALALAGSLIASSRGQGPAVGAAPAENVRLPIEYHENGRVKTQVVAGRAAVGENGIVEATRVRIELMQPTGELEAVATTDRCRYDRQNGTASSDAPVRLERGDLVVSGTGFDWNAAEQTVRIRADAKAVLPGNLRLLPAGRPGAPAKESGRKE